ncbi:uncharacterized protein LOC119281203 [Triticum dicoccoides]|uniref:uncharacterized protein LOC119281203 n=1 Tax=Triticum dicoccoides TaxID=85692 RepID=UPI00189048DF|nr:uncharacterized protein LOC119281203 [Triticum dicoccoides]
MVARWSSGSSHVAATVLELLAAGARLQRPKSSRRLLLHRAGSEEEEPPTPVAVLFCTSSSPSGPTRPCVSGLVPASRSPRLRPPPSSSRSTSAVPRLVRTKPRRPLLDRASAGHLRLELPEIAPAASSPLCVPRRRSCFIPTRLRPDPFASTPSAAIGTCIPCFVNEETSAAPSLTCCTASVDETTSPVWASSAPRPSLRPAACLHLLTDWV